MAPANYFSHATAAERYAKYRPYFHPLLIEHLVKFTGCARFDRALDVACGTGQSTRALVEICNHIDAVDNSASMLVQAPALSNVTYQNAAAEALPFANGAFDLITVGLGFHWFDRDKFLREAARVLKAEGWLCLYNNVFQGMMRDCPEFKKWVSGVFLKRYMTPPRARRKLTPVYAGEFGFELLGPENFPNEVVMTREQLAGYFLSQSNVIAFVEQGSESIEAVAAWINEGLGPYFEQPTRTMQFGSDVWYLRKQG